MIRIIKKFKHIENKCSYVLHLQKKYEVIDMENKIDKKKFGTNAIISRDNLGFLFVNPYLQVSKYGEFIVATNNTCNTYDAVVGGDYNKDFYTELITDLEKIKEEFDAFHTQDHDEEEAKKRLIAFCNSLKEFMEHNQDANASTKIIFPSYGNNDNILLDLSNCLPYEFKGFAFPFSGHKDNDSYGLIKDRQKMNVADLYGLGKIDFKNGSKLVSWLPTGTNLGEFIGSLKSLLKNAGYSFTNDKEYYGVYIIQSLMNIIFASNAYLPLSEMNKIVNNYMQVVNGVFAEQKDLFNEFKNMLEELKKNEGENNKQDKITENRDFYFVKFLFKKICIGTSLEKIDLDTEENKTKYFELVIGICNFLCGADHANQVLVLQKQNSVNSTFGNGIILKNKNLYVPFYKILQRFSKSEKFMGNDNKFYVGKNSDESKAFRQNLTFMINLSGKLRHTKTEFDLSKTKSQKEYKFGCQQNAKGDYLNPINYDTDINAKKLINLTKQIIKFEKDVVESRIDLATLVGYLLDGRYFGCIPGFDSECIKKIIENEKLMNEFFEGVKTRKRGPRCCKAYKIFVNEYFDFITDSKFIDQEYLEDENLAKFFLRPENNEKIMELEPKKILELNLISKLDVNVLNKFLRGSNEDRKKINGVLKLCVNRLESEKLSNLDFGKLDSEIIEAIILFKDQILSKDIVKNIDFKLLSLGAQVKLFNWMAKNKFDSFTKEHLEQIDSDVFTDKSISIEDLGHFCTILYSKFDEFNRFDILNKLPVDLLLLYGQIFLDYGEESDFIRFLEKKIDRNTHIKVKVCSKLSNDQILSIGSFLTGSIKSNKFEQGESVFKQLNSEIINNPVKTSVYDFADRFYGKTNNNTDIKRVPLNLLLWLKQTRKLDKKQFSDVIKYIFDNHKNFRLYAFTILEFVLSDEVHAGFQNKKNVLEEIKQIIKEALDWSNLESRKKIIKNYFSCIDDINKFIDCIEYIDITRDKYKNSLISMYKSFLNNLVAKYSDDLEKEHVEQIPFYYLEKKNIEILCIKYPRYIKESNFSALTKKFNSISKYSRYISDQEYTTFVSVLDKFAGVAMAYEKNKDNNNKIFNEIDANYINHIETNMNKIRNGYYVQNDLVLEKVRTDLEKYNVSKEKLTNQSLVCNIFKSLIDKSTTVEDFIDQDDKNFDKNKLETILKDKNYDGFEKMFLQVIKKDWQEKDFKTFAEKYNLLKHIGNDSKHIEKIVNLYVDFREKKLSEQEFMVKHCLNYKWLNDDEKGEIYKTLANVKNEKLFPLDNGNQYTDLNKYNCLCFRLMQNFDYVKSDNAKKEIIGFLMSNIKLINSDVDVIIGDDTWKKFVQNKFDGKGEEVKKYLAEIKDFVSRINLIFPSVKSGYNTTDNSNHWIEKILFGDSNDNAISKLRQLSVVYDDYQKSKKESDKKESDKKESDWIDFSEVHILKYISEPRIEQYVKNKNRDKQFAFASAANDGLKTLLTEFCRGLNVNYAGDPKKNKLQDVFSKLMEEKKKLVKDLNKNLFRSLKKDSEANNFNDYFCQFLSMLKSAKITNDKSSKCNELNAKLVNLKAKYKVEYEKITNINQFGVSVDFFLQLIEDIEFLMKKCDLQDNNILKNMIDNIETLKFEYYLASFLKLLLDYSKLTSQQYKQLIDKNNKNKILDEKELCELQDKLKKIYTKYKEYKNQLFSLDNLLSIKDDFTNDFNIANPIIKNISSCFSKNKKRSCEILDVIFDDFVKPDGIIRYRLDNYEKILTQEKFLEFAYKNRICSDIQIKDNGIINFCNDDLQVYIPGFVVKYLPIMLACNKSIKHGLIREENAIIENLYLIAKDKDKSYLEDILCKNIKDNKKLAQIMEKISFDRAKDIDSDNYKNGFLWDNIVNVGEKSKQQTDFRKFLRTQLLSLLGYNSTGKIKTGKDDNKGTLMEYPKMTDDVHNQEDIYGFILADFSFISLVNSCTKNKMGENFDITEKLEELTTNIRNRLKTILNYVDNKDNKQSKETLSKIKDKDKDKLDLDLNELIARGFLRLQSYGCLKTDFLSDNNSVILYEKIISMLARCSSVKEFREKKFNNVQEIKDWIQNSSLRYFVPLRLWNESVLFPNYDIFFDKIFMHILDRKGNIPVLDILKNLYDPDAYENKRIYPCKISTNNLIELFNKLADETKSDNLESNMQILQRGFLDPSLCYKTDKNDQGNRLIEAINKVFTNGNIFDEHRHFRSLYYAQLWLSFFLSSHLGLICTTIMDNFCSHINFDKISIDDIISLWYQKERNELNGLTNYWRFIFLRPLISKINKQIKSSAQTNIDSIKKFIQFLCDTDCIMSDKFDNSICFSLFDKIIEITNNNVPKNHEGKDASEIDKLIKNFDSIDTVLSQINANEECKTKLNQLPAEYTLDYISRCNSVNELKKLLGFIKQKNGNKFSIISLNNKDKDNKHVNIADCGILKDMFNKLKDFASNKKNPVEQVFDSDIFMLIVDFLGNLKFKEPLSDKDINSIQNVIVGLCPKEFESVEQFNIYVSAIKQSFLTNEIYPKLYQKILKKLLFGTEKLSIFDVIYILDLDNGLDFCNSYVNNNDTELRKIWSDFVRKCNEQIEKELKEGQELKVKQILTKPEDRFNILLNSDLLKSSFMRAIETGDISYVKNLLQRLPAIKNISGVFDKKGDLEKYFNEIWKPILDSDYLWQTHGDVEKKNYLKANAGWLRKIFIEDVLCKQENETFILDVLDFAVKIPTDENKKYEKVEIKKDVTDKICEFCTKVNDKNLAKQGLDVLNALFKSNSLYEPKEENKLMHKVFVKTLNIPEINSKDDIDKFLDSLEEKLDEYKEYNLIKDENILIEIFKARGKNVTISQMFKFINDCKHSKVLLAQSSIKFFEYLIADLENNNFYLQSDDIGMLCKLLDAANSKYRGENGGHGIGNDTQNYQKLKPLVNNLADGCIHDIKQFEIITKYCTNGDYNRSCFLDYDIADMILLRKKVNEQLIESNISGIAETTAKYIQCTHNQENVEEQTPAKLFDLLLDGFMTSNLDSTFYENKYIRKQLIANFSGINYGVQEYVESFAVKLSNKPKENFTIYRNKFVTDFKYALKAGLNVHQTYKVWLGNMYILTCLFESHDLLLQSKNFGDVVSQIYKKDKLKVCSTVGVQDVSKSFKVFLITQVKMEKMTLNQMKEIAERLDITFDDNDSKLICQYGNISNNKEKISTASNVNDSNLINQIITNSVNINIDNKLNIIPNNNGLGNQIIDNENKNGLISKAENANQSPNYPLFYVMLILTIILLAVLVFAIIKFMWVLLAIDGLCCVITSIFTYRNRPFCRNANLQTISTGYFKNASKNQQRNNKYSYISPEVLRDIEEKIEEKIEGKNDH